MGRDVFKYVFVVNLWKEQRPGPDAQETWRGSVRMPRSRPVFFSTFNRLVEVISKESQALSMPWDPDAGPSGAASPFEATGDPVVDDGRATSAPNRPPPDPGDDDR